MVLQREASALTLPVAVNGDPVKASFFGSVDVLSHCVLSNAADVRNYTATGTLARRRQPHDERAGRSGNARRCGLCGHGSGLDPNQHDRLLYADARATVLCYMPLLASDRVQLIQYIANRLRNEGSTMAHMILGQFDVPVIYVSEEEFVIDRNLLDQIVDRTERADDDILLALGQHLDYEPGPSPPTAEPNFWKDGYFCLFISHLAERQQIAGEIQNELLDYGVSSFVAHNDIEPTSEWQAEIESALATCDGMLALLHPGFHESKWTDQEIGYALGRRLFIVPVRFGADPYGFIGRFQAMDGSTRSAQNLAGCLFGMLSRHEKTRERMAQGAMQAFEESHFYDDVRRRMGHLERLAYWDASLSSRARSAFENKDPIKQAYTVPERLKDLLEKMEDATF